MTFFKKAYYYCFAANIQIKPFKYEENARFFNFVRKLLLVFFHQFDESLEEIFGIVRTGRRFGMILDGENRQSFVTDSGNRFVIEINVSYFNLGG